MTKPRSTSSSPSSEKEPSVIRVGNIYPSGGQGGVVVDPDGISSAVCENHGEVTRVIERAVLRRSRTDEEKERRRTHGDAGAKFSAKDFHPRTDGIANTLTSAQQDNLLIEPQVKAVKYGPHQQDCYMDVDGLSRCVCVGSHGNTGDLLKVAEPIRVPQPNGKGYAECPQGGVFDASYLGSATRRGRVQEGGKVSPTVCAASNGLCLYEGAEETPDAVVYRIRKLTPRECFRLMDVDEADIDAIEASGVSKSRQYKLAGNSIVVSCMYHIFKRMFQDELPTDQQLSLF